MASEVSSSPTAIASDSQQKVPLVPSVAQRTQKEVEDRLGLVPNFFRTSDREISANLWNFACFAYLDNPLPSLFKERLFVYLSRFCEARYCVVRHFGFLIGLGRPAGDADVRAQTVEEALTLLRRPLPRSAQIQPHLALCTSCDEPLRDLPPPDTPMEAAIFTCAAHVFLQTPEASHCLPALKRVFGDSAFEHLSVFLTFIQTAHYWTSIHPELAFEDDVKGLLDTHQRLSDCLLNDPEAGSCPVDRKLIDELAALPTDKLHEVEKVRNIVEASVTEDRLRRSNAALAAHVAKARDAHRAALNVMEDAIAAKDALKEADKRKDEFLATLAHELRNPLAPIRSSVQIMRMAGADTAVTEQARQTVERQVSHLVRLVDDLLDVSRISSNKLDLRKDQVAMAVIVQSAIETSRPLMESSGQKLTVTLPSETIWLHADLTRMAQAVSNLLNNAAKYTPSGGHIWLTVERQQQHAVLSIRDTGIGIPREMLPHIFAMFRQVDTSQERVHGGLGIGLTLVKNLVEMHEGTVEARSAGTGQGSEFNIRLPLAPDPPEPLRKASVVEPVRSTAKRVLVVDDNRDAAESLAQLLTHSGHDTRVAYDGREALQVSESFRPDVMLLDIGMPELSGYEVARRVRHQPWGKGALLIALTGWGQEEDRSMSQQAGFDAHFVKPVEYKELMALFTSTPGQHPLHTAK